MNEKRGSHRSERGQALILIALAFVGRAADEFVQLNSINPANTNVFVCTTYFAGAPLSMHDATLCPAAGDPPRKFVRVTAQMPVDFAFLPIIGFDRINISANAISEAASIDLVLAIDNSSSMAYDLCATEWDEHGRGGGGPLTPGDPELDDCNGYPDITNEKGGSLAHAA